MIEVSEEEYSELMGLIFQKEKRHGEGKGQWSAFEQNVYNGEYCVKSGGYSEHLGCDAYYHDISIYNIKTKKRIFSYDFCDFIGPGAMPNTIVKIEDGYQSVLEEITDELREQKK